MKTKEKIICDSRDLFLGNTYWHRWERLFDHCTAAQWRSRLRHSKYGTLKPVLHRFPCHIVSWNRTMSIYPQMNATQEKRITESDFEFAARAPQQRSGFQCNEFVSVWSPDITFLISHVKLLLFHLYHQYVWKPSCARTKVSKKTKINLPEPPSSAVYFTLSNSQSSWSGAHVVCVVSWLQVPTSASARLKSIKWTSFSYLTFGTCSSGNTFHHCAAQKH